MLDQLKNLLRQETSAQTQTGIADSEKAVDTASHSILDTLRNAISSGKIKDVLGYFNSGSGDHPVVKNATGEYATRLKQEGVPTSQAEETAGKVIPAAMSKLASKTSDPSDKSFQIQDIFNHLSGGKTGSMDIQNIFSKFKNGLDKDNDGDVDFQDLTSMFSGGGGIMDKVKDMFGKK